MRFEELSGRTLRALESVGIRSLEDLEKFSDEDLLKIKNFGRISLREVRAFMRDNSIRGLKPADLKAAKVCALQNLIAAGARIITDRARIYCSDEDVVILIGTKIYQKYGGADVSL